MDESNKFAQYLINVIAESAQAHSEFIHVIKPPTDAYISVGDTIPTVGKVVKLLRLDKVNDITAWYRTTTSTVISVSQLGPTMYKVRTVNSLYFLAVGQSDSDPKFAIVFRVGNFVRMLILKDVQTRSFEEKPQEVPIIKWEEVIGNIVTVEVPTYDVPIIGYVID